MADSELEILIKFGLDPTQARAAQGEIAKIRSETKATGEEAENWDKVLSKSTSERRERVHDLRAALHALGRAFPEVGHLARFLFSPLTIGFGLVAIGIKQARDAVKDFIDSMKEVGDVAAKPVGGMADAIVQFATEAIKADRVFKQLNDNIEREAKSSMDAIDQQKDALLRLSEAAMKYEIATSAKEDEEDIRRRYGQETQQIKELADAKRIATKEDEYMKKAAQAAALEKSVAGMDPVKVALLIKELPALKAQVKELQELKGPGAATPAVMGGVQGVVSTLAALLDIPKAAIGIEPKGTDISLGRELAGVRESVAGVREKATTLAGTLPAREIRLTEIQQNIKALEDVRAAMESLKAEIQMLRTRAATEKSVGGVEGAYSNLLNFQRGGFVRISDKGKFWQGLNLLAEAYNQTQEQIDSALSAVHNQP